MRKGGVTMCEACEIGGSGWREEQNSGAVQRLCEKLGHEWTEWRERAWSHTDTITRTRHCDLCKKYEFADLE
jgi:hypothetical protein